MTLGAGYLLEIVIALYIDQKVPRVDPRPGGFARHHHGDALLAGAHAVHFEVQRFTKLSGLREPVARSSGTSARVRGVR